MQQGLFSRSAAADLQALRKQLRLTQEDFAHALGVTAGTYGRWEREQFNPSKLAQAKILAFCQRNSIQVPTALKTVIGSGPANEAAPEAI